MELYQSESASRRRLHRGLLGRHFPRQSFLAENAQPLFPTPGHIAEAYILAEERYAELEP